jgi:hypothetical protein
MAHIIEAAGIDGFARLDPGFLGDWPPFHARVVKPSTSVFTPQRSSVRARMSAQVAAT